MITRIAKAGSCILGERRTIANWQNEREKVGLRLGEFAHCKGNGNVVDVFGKKSTREIGMVPLNWRDRRLWLELEEGG